MKKSKQVQEWFCELYAQIEEKERELKFWSEARQRNWEVYINNLDNDIKNPAFDAFHDCVMRTVKIIDEINELSRITKSKYANYIQYSDIDPYEIIEWKTKNTIVVRSMKATETEEGAERLRESFEPGGFCGHFDNDVQEWDISSDPDGYVITLRRHKDGCFYNNGRKFALNEKPIKFYDYNF